MPNHAGNASDLGDVLGPICDRHEATLPQIALAWLLVRSPVMLPIPGTSSLTHLEENLGAAADRPDGQGSGCHHPAPVQMSAASE